MMLEMMKRAMFFFQSNMALKMLGELINKGNFCTKIEANKSVLIMWKSEREATQKEI